MNNPQQGYPEFLTVRIREGRNEQDMAVPYTGVSGKAGLANELPRCQKLAL